MRAVVLGFVLFGAYGQTRSIGLILIAPWVIIIVSALVYSWLRRRRQRSNRPEARSLSDRMNARGGTVLGRMYWSTLRGKNVDPEWDQKPPPDLY
jgi:hypothetical protein